MMQQLFLLQPDIGGILTVSMLAVSAEPLVIGTRLQPNTDQMEGAETAIAEHQLCALPAGITDVVGRVALLFHAVVLQEVRRRELLMVAVLGVVALLSAVSGHPVQAIALRRYAVHSVDQFLLQPLAAPQIVLALHLRQSKAFRPDLDQGVLDRVLLDGYPDAPSALLVLLVLRGDRPMNGRRRYVLSEALLPRRRGGLLFLEEVMC